MLLYLSPYGHSWLIYKGHTLVLIVAIGNGESQEHFVGDDGTSVHGLSYSFTIEVNSFVLLVSGASSRFWKLENLNKAQKMLLEPSNRYPLSVFCISWKNGIPKIFFSNLLLQCCDIREARDMLCIRHGTWAPRLHEKVSSTVERHSRSEEKWSYDDTWNKGGGKLRETHICNA